MTTFEFDVTPKEQDGARGISTVNRFVLSLLRQRMKEEGMTKKKLADLLEIDKSTVTRMLRGNQNLTSRTIGEICGALGFSFELIEKDLRATRTNQISSALDKAKPSAGGNTGGRHPLTTYHSTPTPAGEQAHQ